MKSLVSPQNQSGGLIKKNRQVGNTKTKFLSEPDMCVEIKSLKKEYQEYGKEEITYKPVDIYLKHC